MSQRICTLFREQRIKMISILNALSMTISAIAFAITGVFGEERGEDPAVSVSSLPKYEGELKNA